MDRVTISFDFIICPIADRQAVLQTLPQKLIGSRRFYTKEQLLSGTYFSFGKQAVVFLMEQYKYSYQIAKQRLRQLFFLENSNASYPRIEELKQIVTSLENNGLLTRMKFFPHAMKGKRALAIGYDHDVELKDLATSLDIDLTYLQYSGDQMPEVLVFDTLKEEIHYQFNRIALLIDSGIAPSDIVIICNDPEATFDLRLAAREFGIPLNNFDTEAVGGTEMAINAIKQLTACRDFALTKTFLQQTYRLDDSHPIIVLIDDVDDFDTTLEVKIAYLTQSIGELRLRQDRYIAGIEFGGSLYPSPSKHVFVIGASQGVIPKIHSDTDFLSDKEKRAIGSNDSAILNKIESSRWETFLLNQPHLCISYHRYGYKVEKFPSPLFGKLNIIPKEAPLLDVDYGQGLASIKAAALLDEQRVYQIDHPQLKAYRPLVAPKYRTFDYQFRPFEFGLDTKRMQLSYTAVKTFYQCRFRYYLQYLIKLNDDSDNFYAKFGEFAHELLEQAYNPDFEFETAYEQLYAKYVFSPKEQVLLVRLKQDLAEVINFNRDHEANMSLESMLHEHTVKFRLDDITSFKGKIDKVWITKDADGQRYLSLVDYKTSNEDFDARKLPYGHSMQLPTYALLLHEDDTLKQIEVIGLYIQNIIAGKLVRPLGKDPREFYRDQLRLAGLSTSDTAKLATLDKDYQQSQYIRTIGTIKSGELKKSAKVADAATFESYRELTRTKIVEAVKEIRSHRFNIDPKRFSGSDHSCQYCPFRDICFRKEEAYIDIKLGQEDDEDESAAE